MINENHEKVDNNDLLNSNSNKRLQLSTLKILKHNTDSAIELISNLDDEFDLTDEEKDSINNTISLLLRRKKRLERTIYDESARVRNKPLRIK